MASVRFLFALLFAASLAAPLAVQGQDKAMTQEQMMELMMKYANPAKEHELLKKYVGTWEAEVKSWAQPGAPPTVEKGTMKGELIFGGRYLEAEFSGNMMNMPFQGKQIIGFDLFQKKYVSFWIDTMGTGFFLTSGTLDASGKTVTETGMLPDPMTGSTSKVKTMTIWLTDGKYRYEMYMVGPDGKAVKSMEITYTKRSSM